MIWLVQDFTEYAHQRDLKVGIRNAVRLIKKWVYAAYPPLHHCISHRCPYRSNHYLFWFHLLDSLFVCFRSSLISQATTSPSKAKMLKRHLFLPRRYRSEWRWSSWWYWRAETIANFAVSRKQSTESACNTDIFWNTQESQSQTSVVKDGLIQGVL